MHINTGIEEFKIIVFFLGEGITVLFISLFKIYFPNNYSSITFFTMRKIRLKINNNSNTPLKNNNTLIKMPCHFLKSKKQKRRHSTPIIQMIL